MLWISWNPEITGFSPVFPGWKMGCETVKQRNRVVVDMKSVGAMFVIGSTSVTKQQMRVAGSL